MSLVRKYEYIDFIKYVKQRMKVRFNFLLAVVGPTGIGKSYAGLRLCSVLDPNKDFDVSHICFTVEEFFDFLNKAKNNCFVLFDEVGVAYSHRQFQKLANKMLSFVFQTFRYKFINVCFTLPSLNYMDVVGRGLLHNVIRMVDRGYGVVYKVQKNYLGSNIYYKRIGKIKFELPDMKLVEAYERKKDKVMSSRYKTWGVEVKAKEKVSEYKYMPPLEIAKRIVNHLDDFKNAKGKIDAFLISGLLGINTTKAYTVKRLLESGVVSKRS